jgi:hypothetical protein
MRQTVGMDLTQAHLPSALQHVCSRLSRTLLLLDSGTPVDPTSLRQEGTLALLGQMAGLQEAARAEFARNTMLDAAHQSVIAPILQTFAKPILAIKGAHLAHSVYELAGYRTRTDTDVWIDRGDREILHRLLLDAGWQASNSQFGELELPERTYTIKSLAHLVSLDVHWGLSVRPAIARVFDFEQIYARTIPGKFAGMRVPADIDALLIAAQHLLGHHRDERRAIWLIDIWLLWQRLSPEQQQMCVQQAQKMQIASLLLEAVRCSFALMQENFPPDLAEIAQTAKRTEALAALLDHSEPLWRIDWRTCTWVERYLQIKERVWAKPEFLRARFQAPNTPIAFLQIRRWLAAITRKAKQHSHRKS